MSDQEIEKAIQKKVLTATQERMMKTLRNSDVSGASITPEDIEANIVHEEYFTAFEGMLGNEIATSGTATVLTSPAPKDKSPFELLTFCVLVLENGFTVTGESACVSPENFNAEIGRKIARQNAVQKIWPLMGYSLKQRLFVAENS